MSALKLKHRALGSGQTIASKQLADACMHSILGSSASRVYLYGPAQILTHAMTKVVVLLQIVLQQMCQ